MVCFFASTKFQIINAVNIVLQNRLDADLYIINEYIYDNCSELSQKISAEKIFCNVKLIETDIFNGNTSSTRLNTLNLYVHCGKVVESFLLREEYEKIYFCTNSIIERLVRFYFLSAGAPSTKFIMYDEGAASYMGIMETSGKLTERIVRYMLFGKKSLNTVYNKYLYVPEFYYKFNDSNYGTVFKIDPIGIESNAMSACKRIFGFNENECIKEKFIFLDTVHKRALKKDAQNNYERIMEHIFNMTKDNLIVKSHPSDKSSRIDGVKYSGSSGCPFEIIAANSDIDGKILITLSSTASVTPKIIFDKEPTVILLYKLFSDSLLEWNSYYDAFFQKVKESYRDKNRFFIPKTKDELEKNIKSILFVN